MGVHIDPKQTLPLTVNTFHKKSIYLDLLFSSSSWKSEMDDPLATAHLDTTFYFT